MIGAPSPVPQGTLTPPPDEEEESEWENHRNQEMLLQSFARASRLVQEANMLSEELKRDTFFKLTLQIPPKYLRPKGIVSAGWVWSGVQCMWWCAVVCPTACDEVWCVSTNEVECICVMWCVRLSSLFLG